MLFTRAFELRQASSQTPRTQEHARLVADDAGQTQSAPVDPFMRTDDGNNDQRIAGLSTDQLCTICLDAPKDSFFDPCGHRCTCYSCGMKLVSFFDKFCFPFGFECMLLVICKCLGNLFPIQRFLFLSDSCQVVNRSLVPFSVLLRSALQFALIS